MAYEEADFTYTLYSDVRSRKVEWLWYPYIPCGKVTILQGDPGEGKSTFILQLTALLTKGGELPDQSGKAEPCSVIYQCAEDSIEDTVKPRLEQADADCSKVAFIPDGDDPLTFEDDRIEQAVKATGARLLVLDPIQAFLTSDGDMQSAARMRSSLRKLAEIAERHRCAIVLIGHLNKGTSSKRLYRGLGSIDIAAQARSILMITRDACDPAVRYMFPIKSSLAPEGEAIGFRLDADTGFEWLGKCGYDIRNAEAEVAPLSKLDIAKRYIVETLRKEDTPSSVIFEHLEDLGIAERTAKTAKAELAVQTYKLKNVWYWHFAEADAEETDTE